MGQNVSRLDQRCEKPTRGTCPTAVGPRARLISLCELAEAVPYLSWHLSQITRGQQPWVNNHLPIMARETRRQPIGSILLSGSSSVRHAGRRKSRKVRTCDQKKKPTWRDRNSSVESAPKAMIPYLSIPQSGKMDYGNAVGGRRV